MINLDPAAETFPYATSNGDVRDLVSLQDVVEGWREGTGRSGRSSLVSCDQSLEAMERRSSTSRLESYESFSVRCRLTTDSPSIVFRFNVGTNTHLSVGCLKNSGRTIEST